MTIAKAFNYFLFQMSEYNAHVQMMGLHNDMCELNEAQSSYFSATQLTYQIQLVSFGQRLVFEGRLHKEISAMLLENGSFNSSLGWARQALQVFMCLYLKLSECVSDLHVAGLMHAYV